MNFRDDSAFRPYATAPWFRRLRDEFNVRHVEQLAGLLQTEEGRLGLTELGTPVEELRPLLESRLAHIAGSSLVKSKLAAAATSHEYAHDMISWKQFHHFIEHPLTQSPSEGPPVPREFWYHHELPPASDQGQRGTSVAFAAVAMFELMVRRLRRPPVTLSPEFLFAFAKEKDNLPDVDGTTMRAALEVLRVYGVCTERLCRYFATKDHEQSYLSAAAVADALRHRITGWEQLPRTITALKEALVVGRPIGLGLSVYETAWFNLHAVLRGELMMPLTSGPSGQEVLRDRPLGGQSVVLVGYRDNNPHEPTADRPGGGFFGFANSWGGRWAADPDEYPLPPGYGIVPYAYVAKYALDAYVIDGLLLDDVPYDMRLP